jgi:hypothetical protein
VARTRSAAGLIAAVGLLAGWLAIYAVTARLSDDGLHAYAARAMLSGQRLYVDFEYHQAPLLPYVLAGWFRLCGVGMTQAKLFSALIAALTLWAMSALARRAGAGPDTVVLMLLAAALSPSLVLHLQYVQSQGLAALLTCAALLAARKGTTNGSGYFSGQSVAPTQETAECARSSLTPFLGALALAALAAAARISFVVVLPALLWRRPWKQVLSGLAVWAGVLTVCLLPHLLAGRLMDMLYLPFGAVGNLVTQRYVGLYSPGGGLAEAVSSRLGSWPNQFIYYAPLWLLVIIAAAKGPSSDRARRLLGVAVLLTLAHGVLPRRVNHSYLVVAMPFWAAWAAARLPGAVPRPKLVLAGLLLCAIPAMLRGVGRVDLSGGRTVLAELAEIGERIDRELPADGKLLTFSPECAVAADRDVLDGLAPGYFAYYPNMTDAEAVQARVVNTERLLAAIVSGEAQVALLHDTAFEPLETPRIAWPDPGRFWAAVDEHYEPVQSWREVGEKRQGLTLHRRR